ncbi:MAG: WD40 repeat domain-containing protein, partial [Gaiellaceae bacterium]
FEANGNRVTEIAFSPDGALLATASTDPTSSESAQVVLSEPARMWSATSGAQVGADLPLRPEEGPVDVRPLSSLDFSADGETLITTGPSTLRRWSVPAGELLSSSPADLIGGFATLPGDRIALEVNGRFVVRGGAGLEPESDFVDLQQGISGAGAIAATADGHLVALGWSSGIFLWSPSGQQLLAQATPTGVPGIESVIPFDEHRLRSPTSGENPLSRPLVWDMRESSPEAVQFAPSHYFLGPAIPEGQRQWDVFGMTYFKPDEPPRPAEVWDKETLSDTGIRLGTEPVIVIGVRPERGWMIGASFTELYVFDIDTGEVIARRAHVADFGSEARFNADSTRMLTFAPQRLSTTLWDTETWEVVKEFSPLDGDGVVSAVFAPSGELLSVDPNGTIAVRDPESLETSGSPMVGKTGFFISFSPDGTRLWSIGNESMLWDFESRTRIADGFPFMQYWPGPDSSERGVTVEDDNILIWNLNTDEWYDVACRAAGRNMTRAEWDEIGPGDAEYQATCPQFPLEPEIAS